MPHQHLSQKFLRTYACNCLVSKKKQEIKWDKEHCTTGVHLFTKEHSSIFKLTKYIHYVAANALHYFECITPAKPRVPKMLKNSKHTPYFCQSLSCIPALFKKAMPFRWPHRFAGVRVWNILYVDIKMCRSSIIHKPCVFVSVSYISNREAVIICGL